MLAEGDQLAPAYLEYLAADKRRASDLMIKEVVMARPDVPLPELATLLTHHKIKCVPILREVKLVSVVSGAEHSLPPDFVLPLAEHRRLVRRRRIQAPQGQHVYTPVFA